MEFAGISTRELEAAGAAITAREIAQQPAVWRKLAEQAGHPLHRFLAPLLGRPELQIVLSGAGTSAHIGECLAPAMTRRFGTRVRAIATTDLVADPHGWLSDAPLLLVSFARSGNSPESVAALELAGRVSGECHHLIITCNAQGELCRRGEGLPAACVMRLPDETNDRAFAMTSSFSSMLLAGALAFDLIDGHRVDELASWADQMLHHPSAAALARSGFERVVYLGDRELRGLSRESALKLLELTDGRVAALSDSPLGFRHGPKTFIDARTLVVVFLSNDAYARAYELDLLNELRQDGIAARVLAVSATEIAHAPNEIVLTAARAATDLELCFPYVVFAQSMAMQTAMAMRLRPDSPNARGVVNRVVQGVTVYPWAPGR